MRDSMRRRFLVCALGLLLTGCQSAGYTGKGALLGGVLGSGIGALASSGPHGNVAAGAALGAGLGAVTGAIVGNQMDRVEAENHAVVDAVRAQAVTTQEVLAMSDAGVADQVVVNHIDAHGVLARPTSSEVILMQERGVSPLVISAMQTAPIRVAVVEPVAPAVIVAPRPVVPVIHVGPRRAMVRPRRRW